MKRKLLSLGAAILFVTGSQAQTEFGLEGGVNFSTCDCAKSEKLDRTESTVGFYAAAYLDTRIAPVVYFHPQVSLQRKGGKLIESESSGGGEIIQKTTWLDLSLNFLGKVPIGRVNNVFAGAGPYLGFGMDGTGTSTYSNGSNAPTVILHNDNALKSFDYGINFLAGVKVWKRFSLKAHYRVGMVNIAEEKYKWSDNIKNRVFSLGIGVAL
ncbi:MAG TPA: outer membrane beta-barrel protein [Sphingobacterium sp.]|nr:outer membrane beta-barrel protein [Sphingobacterium sp.]